MVVVGAPNDLHCAITLDAAAAGKHVVMEKPLCLNLAEADRMIAACRKAGVKLMYAEELCFAPKYVRLKQLLDSGALGRPTLVKQSEKHDGPHAAHFWDVERSGGGVTMDMGCHAIEFFRWMLGRPRDQVRLRPDGHARARRQDARRRQRDPHPRVRGRRLARRRGELDQARRHGRPRRGPRLPGRRLRRPAARQRDRDLQRRGYDYAVEKAGSTEGWSFTIYEEAWNYGFPQEMAHFVDCVQNDRAPLVTGEDGRAVLEVIFAAYESARTGRKGGAAVPDRRRPTHRPVEVTRAGARGGCDPGQPAFREAPQRIDRGAHPHAAAGEPAH